MKEKNRDKKYFYTRAYFLAVLTLFLLILSGCSLGSGRNSQELQVRSNKITIAWDPPVISMKYGPFSITSYNIYYREHGTQHWIFLDSTENIENWEFVIQHEILGNGKYDFAITAVYKSGLQSPYHSSLDPDAEPFYGWYINWTYF